MNAETNQTETEKPDSLPAEVVRALAVIENHFGGDDWAIGFNVVLTPEHALPDDIAEQYARMVQIAFRNHGAQDMAHRIVDEAFKVGAERAGRTVGLSTGLASILPMRIANDLERAGKVWVADLVVLTENEMVLFPNVGVVAVQTIKRILAKHGFSLAEESEIARNS